MYNLYTFTQPWVDCTNILKTPRARMLIVYACFCKILDQVYFINNKNMGKNNYSINN